MKKQLFFMCLMMTSVMLINRSVFSQVSYINTWPEFRGKNCSGIAYPEQNPPVDLVSGEKLIWKTPLISGVSSPCIWGDRIFLTGFDKEKRQLQVLCYNRLNGKLIWNRIVPAKKIEPYHVVSSPADATPATDGERIYVHFGSYGLLCYDFAGEILWTIELPVNNDNYGTGTSPIVADNLVILMVRRPNEECYLLALDGKNGQYLWKQSISSAGHSTPIVWGDNLVVHRPGDIAVYRIKDGSEIWHVSVETNGTSTPVTNDDILYVGTWQHLGEQNQRLAMPGYQDLLNKYDTDRDSLISKQEFPNDFLIVRRPETQDLPGVNVNLKRVWELYVDTDKSNFIDSTEWQKYLDLYAQFSNDHGLLAIKFGGTGNITSTHVVWKESESVPEVPSPLYYKGCIYMIKNGGIVTCLEALTGKLLYRARLNASGPYISSPVASKDRIYIASQKGIVVVFAAGDELKVLARNNLREKIMATPAIVDDKLYIRTAKHLYAFGE